MARPVRRVLAGISRRLERPELLAAFYPGARQAWREELAMGAVLAATLREDSTYVDVGTNRGQLLALALQTAPRGSHVAFEPVPELAAGLSARFPGVDCRAMALSVQPGTQEFWHFRTLDGWSGLRRNPQISDGQGDPHRLEVRVSTLDAELEGLRPALVKIDVEGAELGVLEGGREVLARVKPAILLECVAQTSDLYGSTPGSVWDVLTDLGYEVLPVIGGAPVPRAGFGTGATVNWLARPRTETSWRAPSAAAPSRAG